MNLKIRMGPRRQNEPISFETGKGRTSGKDTINKIATIKTEAIAIKSRLVKSLRQFSLTDKAGGAYVILLCYNIREVYTYLLCFLKFQASIL